MYSSLSHSSISSRIVQGTLKYKRAFLPMALLCLIIQPTSRDIVLQALSDAFLRVTMFVAATLYLYYFLVKRFPQLELSYIASISPKLEVPFAAFLGALPGCGGAIIVVTSERISLRVRVRSAITIIYFHKQSPVIGPRRLDPH